MAVKHSAIKMTHKPKENKKDDATFLKNVPWKEALTAYALEDKDLKQTMGKLSNAPYDYQEQFDSIYNAARDVPSTYRTKASAMLMDGLQYGAQEDPEFIRGFAIKLQEKLMNSQKQSKSNGDISMEDNERKVFMNDLEKMLDERFTNINDTVDKKISKLNDNFDSINDKLNNNFDSVNDKLKDNFDSVNKKVSKVSDNFDSMSKRIDELQKETSGMCENGECSKQQLTELNSKLSELQELQNNLSEGFNNVNTLLDSKLDKLDKEVGKTCSGIDCLTQRFEDEDNTLICPHCSYEFIYNDDDKNECPNCGAPFEIK